VRDELVRNSIFIRVGGRSATLDESEHGR